MSHTAGRGPLLGWNVYTGCALGGDHWTFREFIPAEDLDDKLGMLADLVVLEIEEDGQAGS